MASFEKLNRIARECKVFMGSRMTWDKNHDQVESEEDLRNLIEGLRNEDESTELAACLGDWVYHIDDDLNFNLKKTEMSQVVTLSEACFKACANYWLEMSRNPDLKRCLLNLPSRVIDSIASHTPSQKLEDAGCLSFILQTSCTSLKLTSYPKYGFLLDFKKLTNLDVCGCNIPSGPYLQLVKNLPSIKTLSLQSTKAFNKLLGILAERSTNLESLNVEDNLRISDKGILDLCTVEGAHKERQPRSSQLQTLHIVNTKVTLKGCYFAVLHLPRLVHLSFDGSFSVFGKFEDELKERGISKPFSIKSLYAIDGFISHESQIILATRLCPDLTNLEVNLKVISPEMLPVLGNFEKLDGLIMEYKQLDPGFPYDPVIPKFIVHFPSFLQIRGSTLTYLELAEVPANLNLIGRLCPNLIELQLYLVYYEEYGPVVDQKNIFQNLTHLEVVAYYLPYEFQPRKGDLTLLLFNCPQLNHLLLEQVGTMTHALLLEILSHNPMRSLESAVLNRCDNINGECLALLMDSVPSLKELSLSLKPIP